MLTRRETLLVLAACMACAAWPDITTAAAGKSSALTTPWESWKRSFVQDGRVIDPGQQGISTSEGQGYGMLLATAMRDRAGFDAMWTWTRNNLDVRGDGLYAWRWTPGQGVTDRNNASDSDLLIAWALVRAAQRFAQPDLLDAARHTTQAIRSQLLLDTPWGTVLKPAVEGFATPQGQVVNLSYWVFPALPTLAAIDPSPHWQALTDSGLKLLSIARYGRWQLPPDWLLLVDPLVPDPGRPQRFGFEAVRIPLYLYWAKLGSPTRYASFKSFWNSFPCRDFLPAWTNLQDDSIDSFGADPGMRAISTLVQTGKAPQQASPPLAQQTYYSATLWMLVQIAASEGST
ncbi:glycosyl hydrolase family 8 [Thermomonas hydrothermalis]|uniref:cellulase n=1 Tax=Thermomonas hydrothermalis TaxID=213588 RepID=A0A1M5A2U5_9GAMM|nr:glycosyl hydrolase family 8 [Thermomonas hydrothermalis]SHF24598.1 endoglucanase [Thermomonas hydrothermalis]